MSSFSWKVLCILSSGAGIAEAKKYWRKNIDQFPCQVTEAELGSLLSKYLGEKRHIIQMFELHNAKSEYLEPSQPISKLLFFLDLGIGLTGASSHDLLCEHSCTQTHM